jgi:hypothetical protein
MHRSRMTIHHLARRCMVMQPTDCLAAGRVPNARVTGIRRKSIGSDSPQAPGPRGSPGRRVHELPGSSRPCPAGSGPATSVSVREAHSTKDDPAQMAAALAMSMDRVVVAPARSPERRRVRGSHARSQGTVPADTRGSVAIQRGPAQESGQFDADRQSRSRRPFGFLRYDKVTLRSVSVWGCHWSLRASAGREGRSRRAPSLSNRRL